MMQSTKRSEADTRRTPQDLDVRYGEIGIAALAAALRYQGEVKSVPAPATQLEDRWLAEMAA
jgi:hypothetical protein